MEAERSTKTQTAQKLWAPDSDKYGQVWASGITAAHYEFDVRNASDGGPCGHTAADPPSDPAPRRGERRDVDRAVARPWKRAALERGPPPRKVGVQAEEPAAGESPRNELEASPIREATAAEDDHFSDTPTI